MLLAALIDAGASLDRARADISLLGIAGWRLDVVPVTKNGVMAKKAVVEAASAEPRSYNAIRALIEESSLERGIKTRSLATFRRLAIAEAAVHGVKLDDLHFHEVGAVDALVDIVGCASALEQINPDRVVASPLPLGRGTTSSAHGVLPLPAPAVTELLKGAPVVAGPSHETVTPTGAAIIVTAAHGFGDIPPMEISSIGWGAGHRDTQIPNLLRIFVGEASQATRPEVSLIETNIDDTSPELIPHAIDALLAAGAQDAWITPILMKKGRPGFLLAALAENELTEGVLEAIYRETTTFGARVRRVEKDELQREWREVRVGGHPMRVKVARRGGGDITLAAEHDDAVRVARLTGMALKDVYAAALEAAARPERRPAGD